MLASSRGWDLCERMTDGMGPRMREDTGGGGFLPASSRGRFCVGGWVPACARTREGVDSCLRLHGVGSAWEDGSPHPRGQGEGMGARAGFKPAPTKLIPMWASTAQVGPILVVVGYKEGRVFMGGGGFGRFR